MHLSGAVFTIPPPSHTTSFPSCRSGHLFAGSAFQGEIEGSTGVCVINVQPAVNFNAIN